MSWINHYTGFNPSIDMPEESRVTLRREDLASVWRLTGKEEALRAAADSHPSSSLLKRWFGALFLALFGLINAAGTDFSAHAGRISA